MYFIKWLDLDPELRCFVARIRHTASHTAMPEQCNSITAPAPARVPAQVSSPKKVN